MKRTFGLVLVLCGALLFAVGLLLGQQFQRVLSVRLRMPVLGLGLEVQARELGACGFECLYFGGVPSWQASALFEIS